MLKTSYKFGEVHNLLSQVYAGPENVEFRCIFDNTNGGVSLLAFRKGQILARHIAPAEVMVYVIEGQIEFTMLDTPHTLRAGEFILVGEGVPHSVVAAEDSKVMLVKVKSDK